MYKAKIQTVEKTDDEIKVIINFSNGEKTFEKNYIFNHMVDINTSFEETIQNELKRMNDLEKGYIVLKARENEEITSINIIKK